ncbi:DMT family transporter [Bosea caraganae]|uniref:DMT family transporter n=1 Tax=Bosea caraganae TaxID=2763117 RepID=A0A370L0P1_9HYPH|nr:DMT family transporter [Bosea caraganae]RDJ20814.1 DMT family transporter [Bosea caraganae]RDJ21573.1 DMT family transporter [Bosea caraganae]
MIAGPDSAARQQGIALALASAAAFGSNIIGAQLAGQAGLSGPLLVFYRVFIMLALVGVAAALLRASLRIPPGQGRPLIAFGLTSALVGSAYLSSVAFVPVSVAAVVFYTFPVLIVLAEPLLTPARFSPDRLVIALVAFLGVALVVGPGLDGLDLRGLALAMAASVLAAAQFFAAGACARTPLVPKLLWSHLLILPVTIIILWLVGGFLPPQAIAVAPLAFALATGTYLLGFLLQVMALARVAPGAAALAFCAEPVFSVAIAAVVLGERLGPVQYAGGALVVGAIMANVILEQKRAQPAPA